MGADIPESEIKIPEQLRYLYDVFLSIRFSKVPSNTEENQFSLMARDSLTYQDIDIYSKTSGLMLELYEIETLLSLSSIFDRASN